MGPPPREVDIAIIGGGLGGLALAAGLHRRGFDVHVFEAASELRRETSTMIGLGPNGFAALGDIHPDMPDSLKRRGVMNREAVYRYLPPGRDPLIITRDASHTRLCTIRWAETQDALAQLVPPEIVHCGHAATGYEELWDGDGDGGGDSAVDGGAAGNGASFSAPARTASRAVVHFRGQPSVAARLVVGADGVFSAIRAAMHPADPGPRYLGHMNWNCVFPNPGGNTVVDAHKPGQLVVVSDGCIGEELRDPSIYMYIADAGLDYTFLQVRIQSDEPAFTAPDRAPAGPPGEHADSDGDDSAAAANETAYGERAKDGHGGSDEKGRGEGEKSHGQSWRRGRGGMGVPGSKERVLEVLRSAGWHWALPLLEATPERCLFERALYDRLPLPRWSSRGGRVVLLGDSAHAMHPGPGQGARSAFEDAHQLVLALEALWPEVPAALERYQRARIVRATRVQNIAAEGVGIAAIRDAARPAGLSPQEATERWIEFRTWFDQYPNNMEGDPNTKWWKPLNGDGGAGIINGGAAVPDGPQTDDGAKARNGGDAASAGDKAASAADGDYKGAAVSVTADGGPGGAAEDGKDTSAVISDSEASGASGGKVAQKAQAGGVGASEDDVERVRVRLEVNGVGGP